MQSFARRQMILRVDMNPTKRARSPAGGNLGRLRAACRSPPFLDSRQAGSTAPPESSDRLFSEVRRIMAPYRVTCLAIFNAGSLPGLLPRLFLRRSACVACDTPPTFFLPRRDFESGQRQDQGSHTNMGLRSRSRHATSAASDNRRPDVSAVPNRVKHSL
jgi:hypothetical protein